MHWNKMVNVDFEASKKSIDPSKPVPIIIDMPKSVYKEISRITGKNFEDLVNAYNDSDIQWDDDEYAIMLHHPAIRRLFHPVIDKIYVLINNVLIRKDCQSITTVLMVGGFASSKVLFDEIKVRLKENHPHIDTCSSSNPSFSVVMGAVLNAQLKNIIDLQLKNTNKKPSLTSQLGSLSLQTTEITKHLPFVVSRKMNYTIGIEVTVPFDENKLKRSFMQDNFFAKTFSILL